jgi:hypothetical protein
VNLLAASHRFPFRLLKTDLASMTHWTDLRCVICHNTLELARLAKVHITTIVRLEAFDAQQVRGQSGTITAVVNALAKAGIELGENGSIFPRPKRKPRQQWGAKCGADSRTPRNPLASNKLERRGWDSNPRCG